MKEQILREAVRTALKEISGDSKTQTKEEPKRMAPDRDHLSSTFLDEKENLNKELLRRWGIGKKK